VRYVALSAVLVLALATTLKQFAQSARDGDTHELERLERVWNEAHELGDADALQRLWADDLEVDVPRMPVMTKTDVVAVARAGRMKFLRYSTSNLRIRLYGDTAVVTGRLQRARAMNGKQISEDCISVPL
jgi:ketosteroid isomerase-like protein